MSEKYAAPEPKAVDPGLKSEHYLLMTSIERHPSASCDSQGCGWTWPESPSAQAEAMQHAQRKGHTVRLEEVKTTVMEVKPR
jgi:hypothetical protein